MTVDAESAGPQTEQEARDLNARLKKMVRLSSLIYTPVMAAFLWLVDAPYWLGLAAIFLLCELVAYPVIAKTLDRNMETQIAALRERDGLTPAAELPDVGI